MPFSTDRPGSLLILFRDRGGEVLTAYGTGVPAGDFAAAMNGPAQQPADPPS